MDRVRLVSRLGSDSLEHNINFYQTCFLLLSCSADNILVTGRNILNHRELALFHVKDSESIRGGGWLQIRFRNNQPCEIEIYGQSASYGKADLKLAKKILESLYPNCGIRIRRRAKKKNIFQKMFGV